jgi:hypothetical protein
MKGLNPRPNAQAFRGKASSDEVDTISLSCSYAIDFLDFGDLAHLHR